MPGSEVVLARRKNNSWYIAGINGEATEKTLATGDFLTGVKYKINTFLEDADSAVVTNSSVNIIPENVTVKGYGGFIMLVTVE